MRIALPNPKTSKSGSMLINSSTDPECYHKSQSCKEDACYNPGNTKSFRTNNWAEYKGCKYQLTEIIDGLS